ncbi:hypothetical protein JT359_13595 [Candidatus Poribacteria bacterium]|nr:hypothetical protein [Candidatus Poribacteria bacterium]
MNENIDTPSSNETTGHYVRKLKTGDILDSMFSLYRNNYTQYLSIAMIYFLAIVIEYSLKGIIPGRIQQSLIPLLISIPIGIFAIGSGIYVTGSLYMDKTTSLDNSFKHVIHRILPLIGSSLIVRGIIIIGLLSVSFSIIQTFTVGPQGILIGFIVLPITVYILVKWIFHLPIILFENPKITHCFIKSSALVKNSWWRILGILILILIITYAIDSIITFSVAFVMLLFKLGANTDYITLLRWKFMDGILDSNNLIFYSTMTFVKLVTQSLVVPLWVIGYSLLYIDRRIQVEGNFDFPD